MERKRVAEAAKGVGRPKVGGPFSLLDQNGKEFTDGDMKGRYSLVRLLFPMIQTADCENRRELC
jgi:cytochrome oxidase Cu insertion factor (SCO1/SenC/PrrC family)